MSVYIFAVRPPYTNYQPLGAAGPGGFDLEPGTLMALDLRQTPPWSELALDALEVRRANPAAPLVARLPKTLTPGLPELARRLALLEVRAAVPDEQPLAAALRDALAQPIELPERIARWFELRGYGDAIVRQLTLQLLRDADESNGAHPLTLSDPWLRSRLQSLGLPPPARWTKLARLLPAALTLQRDADTNIGRAALELGYSSQSRFTHAMREETGFTPTQVLDMLGWEWLLEGWLMRSVEGVPQGS